MKEGLTQADLIRRIRGERGSKNWNGTAKGDREYYRIKAKVHRCLKVQDQIAKQHEKIKSVKEKQKFLKCSSVKKSDRRLDAQKELEDAIDEFGQQCAEKKQRLTRTMIFRKVLELNPDFLGGVKSKGYFVKMKKWFYGGFKIRYNYSLRKISGAGQKLPGDWEEKMVKLRDRVGIFTRAFEDRSNDVMVNTDHVPVWMEPVGNMTWGKKTSGRCPVCLVPPLRWYDPVPSSFPYIRHVASSS